MVYKPGYLRERSKQLINARKWGITMASGLLGLGLFISEFQKMRKTPLDLMNYGYIALFFMTGWLIFSWIWSTQKELDLLFEWLDPERYEPPSSIKETIIILSLALLLVGLLFGCRNPLLYGFVFTIYSIVDVLAGRKLQAELSEAFDKSKHRARTDLENKKLAEKAKLYLKGLESLEFYFIERYHNRRLVLTLIFSIVGLVLSLCWSATRIMLLGFGSYAIFFVILIISQVIIWHWRIVHDAELRPITAELNELNCESDSDSGDGKPKT